MKHDIIILGGGPNGLAAALALGGKAIPRPLNVLLLDARDPNAIPNDSRGTAMTQAAQAMLRTLGLWEALAEHSAEMRDVLVTDGNGSHQNRPSLLSFATPTGQQAAASMIENRILHQALLSVAQQSPAITLQGGFTFKNLAITGGRITVSSAGGEHHSASLLVAADGRNSPVRKFVGTKLVSHDYGQTALSFCIAHSKPHEHLAEEHFSADGVFAVLPLMNQRCSIVWGTSPEHAAKLMAQDVETFDQSLQHKMGDRLGAVSLQGKRAAYPLSMQLATSFIAPRVALLGDAAHAIHPLAGLGLNLGFKDAAALADCVAAAFARGDDIGSEAVLEKYQAQRRFDTVLTSWAMDAMNGLFVNDNPMLKTMRDAGLNIVDQVPALKSILMQQAGGMSQSNPRLLQGLLPG